MHSRESIFRFENVSFGYPSDSGNVILVENFTGEIMKGELTAVIGRNGTGKSTVLKSMVQLIPVLAGNIYLNNKLLNLIPKEEFPKLISFVSTDLPHTPVMTVYELVSLGRFPFTNWLGTLQKEDHEEVQKALEVTGLIDMAKKALNRVSDGERQRAMIARTLAQNTPIILLDEPTAFLDLPNKYELISLLADLSEQGRSIVFSTHDTGIALRFPDKLLILDNNAITSGAPEDQILNGKVGNIFQSPRFTFSRKTGDVEVIRKASRTVSINCEDDILKEWTIRALKRAGYSINERFNSNTHIEAEVNDKKYSWKIEINHSDHYFYTLYELIYFLKNNLTKTP